MPLTPAQASLVAEAQAIAAATLAPAAATIDRDRAYPSDGLAALGRAGLMGLLAPAAAGGRGGGLTDLALVAEELGTACASTAMCFLMHSCGIAVIAAKANAAQSARWLAPAAAGTAIATLAFSERGSGAHFYMPEITAERAGSGFRLEGRKHFVTSGGHAAFYPVLVNATGKDGLDILVVERGTPGVRFEGTWEGAGMAGNSSVSLVLEGVQVREDALVGAEGDGQELVFNVVAPTFLVGLAAVNVGIARAALAEAASHASGRAYAGGQQLSQVAAIQRYIGEMSVAVESARQLVHAAAAAADARETAALPLVMQAKIAATETATAVTNTAMQVGGGQAYSRQSPAERHWRDARAGAVMAPTNDILKEWLGRILTGLPLF